MDTEIDEEKQAPKERDLKKLAKDILEVVGDAIALGTSPSTLWLAVLWNCNGGQGFNGYVSNNPASPSAQAAAAGLSAPQTGSASSLGSYKGYEIYQLPNGQYMGLKGGIGGRATATYPTIAEVQSWIDRLG
jgi:hypothetical protein